MANKFLCMDCKVDTSYIAEFYFIHTYLWLQATSSKDGMLCIGCLETRLGFTLNKTHFPDVSINSPKFQAQSMRLRARMNAS